MLCCVVAFRDVAMSDSTVVYSRQLEHRSQHPYGLSGIPVPCSLHLLLGMRIYEAYILASFDLDMLQPLDVALRVDSVCCAQATLPATVPS